MASQCIRFKETCLRSIETNKKDAKQDDAKLTLQIKKEVKEEKVKKQSEEFFGKVADTWLEANKKNLC